VVRCAHMSFFFLLHDKPQKVRLDV
jgi:hypothetical protein